MSASDQISSAVNALLDRLGRTVTYVPLVGDEVEITAIVRAGDLREGGRDISPQVGGQVANRAIITVHIDDVPTPVIGDIFDDDGTAWRVDMKPEKTTNQASWWLQCSTNRRRGVR